MIFAPPATRTSAPPLVTVSVVSHGDASPLASLLQSLVRYEVAAGLQLILTDNLGHDLPPLDPSVWHSLVLLRNARPQGYARNHNTAFGLATGKYFCVLNPDVRLVEPVFAPLIDGIESGQGDIAAPLVLDSAGTIQDSFRSLPSVLEILQRRIRRLSPVPDIPADQAFLHPSWIAGIFLFMRRETFGRLNGFDARYWLYFEDVDFCTRARLAGLSIMVAARLRVQHDARRASRREGRYLLWHLQSALRFFTSRTYRQAVALPRLQGSSPKH